MKRLVNRNRIMAVLAMTAYKVSLADHDKRLPARIALPVNPRAVMARYTLLPCRMVRRSSCPMNTPQVLRE